MRTLVLSILLVGLVFARPARAENPNVTFNGRVMMSDKKFPQSAKSPAAYIAQVRKQAKTNFTEDKDDKGKWKVYFAAFLKTKLDDLEYLIKIYEVSGKDKRLVESFEQYTTDRGQQTLTSYLTLDKKTVGVNKELLVTVEYKNKVLASGTLRVLGEGEKNSGKVDFSEEDTKKKDDE